MGYVLFAVSAYIFMRAFEVVFADLRESRGYKLALRAIGCAVLYAAVAAMVTFYCSGIHLLGFDPK